jgi:hypothetical protein
MLVAAATAALCVTAPAFADSLFVDAVRGTLSGTGSHQSPFRTVTQALDRARSLRFGLDGTEPSSAEIVIHVAPGTYRVSFSAADFDPTSSTYDATLERGPILINVPMVTLVGSTVMGASDGWPSGSADPASDTRITAAGTAGTVILITSTISPAGKLMAGNDVTVEGLVIDSTAALGCVASRVQNFLIQGNVVLETTGSAFRSLFSSGAYIGNFADGDATGTQNVGGNADHPSKVLLSGNRFVRCVNGGIFVGGNAPDPSDPVTYFLTGGLGANVGYTLPPSEAADGIEVEVVGNDLSEHTATVNFSFGLRIGSYVNFLHPQQPPTSIVAHVRDNRLVGNRFGVTCDAGFPWQSQAGAPITYTYRATIDGDFADNEISGSIEAPVFFSMTRNTATLRPKQRVPAPGFTSFKYLRDSTFEIEWPGLEAYWWDNPATDKLYQYIDGVWTFVGTEEIANHIIVNGVEKSGTCIAGGCGN